MYQESSLGGVLMFAALQVVGGRGSTRAGWSMHCGAK